MTEKPMMPLSPEIARVLVQVQRDHGRRMRDLLREFIDIERRLDWLNEYEPLAVTPAMSGDEITAALEADPNLEERRALVKR